MNEFYKIEETRERLERIVRERISNGPKDMQLLCYNEDGGAGKNSVIVSANHPYGWKIASPSHNNDGVSEEQVLRIQGVLCEKDIPPVLHPAIIEPRRRRYARQSITLTAFSAPYLQSCQDIIQDIHRGFASLLPESSLEPWHADRHDDHIAIEMGNRYYLHRGGVPASDIIPFKPCVDPDGVLKRSMGPDFAHTHENEVEYFECDVTSDGITQYKLIEPVKFRIGDIVEAQVSFVTIPLRGKQFKMLIILRAITLLDSKTRIDAEKHHQAAKAIPVAPKLKRKVGYLDKEVEETRRKVSNLSVDNLD